MGVDHRQQVLDDLKLYEREKNLLITMARAYLPHILTERVFHQKIL